MEHHLPIKDDTSISRCQVDTKTSCASAQQEHKVAVIGFVPLPIRTRSLFGVEYVHLTLALINIRATVDTTVLPFAVVQVVFHDTQYRRHLAKDEDLVGVLVQPSQHAVQQSELPTGANEQVGMGCPQMDPCAGVNRFSEKKRMVHILSVVHELVGLAQSTAIFNALAQQCITQRSLVDQIRVSCLELGDSRVNNDFLLRRHVFQHIRLDAAKEERTENFMQFRHCLVLLLLNENSLFIRRPCCFLPNVLEAKPRLKD